MGIDPRMWDDEIFVALDDAARGLWTFLIAGPPTVASIPGLLVGGPSGFAEGLRRDPADVRAGLLELQAKGLLQWDETKRVIRIPNGPKYDRPSNGNVVRGWWNRWRKAPESTLKYAHVVSLEHYCSKYHEAWADTFGSLDLRKVFRDPFETVSKQAGSGSGIGSETGSGIGSGSDPDPEGSPEPSTDASAMPEVTGDPPSQPDLFGASGTPAPGQNGNGHKSQAERSARHGLAAARLWQLQHELRKGVNAKCRALSPTAEALDAVCKILEHYSADDCEHVLRVYAAEAAKSRANGGAGEWFDGTTNWRPLNFARALGRPPTALVASAGHARASEADEFQDGKRRIT